MITAYSDSIKFIIKTDTDYVQGIIYSKDKMITDPTCIKQSLYTRVNKHELGEV